MLAGVAARIKAVDGDFGVDVDDDIPSRDAGKHDQGVKLSPWRRLRNPREGSPNGASDGEAMVVQADDAPPASSGSGILVVPSPRTIRAVMASLQAFAFAEGVFTIASATDEGERFRDDSKRVVTGRQAPPPETRFNELGDGAIN